MRNKILLSLTTVLTLASTTYANEVIKLEAITVTASDKFNTKVRDTTANVTVITSEEIKDKGYITLSDALSHVAGFSVASTGGAGQSTSVYLRGFNSGNIQLLLNGVPLKDPTDPSFSSAISHLNLTNVDRIEVIKGAQSGLWGADAVAGVINVVTKKGNLNSAYLGYGKYNTKEAGFALGASSDIGAISINGNYYDTKGFSAMLPRDAEADGYKHYDFNINATANISANSKAGLFYNYIDGKSDYDSSGNANSTVDKSKFNQKLYGANYNYSANNLEVAAKVSRNDIKRDFDGSYGISEFKGKVDRFTLDAKSSIGKNRVAGGLEYAKFSAKSDLGFMKSDDSYKNKAIWASYGYTFDNLLSAKTIVNATLRYDSYDNFKNKLTYRVGVKRYCDALLDGLHSGFNIYSAYKVPSLYQFSNKLAGNELKPESTTGFEVTFGYKNLINLTYFYAKTEDYIAYNSASYAYYNEGYDVKRKGIELSSKYNFSQLPLSIGFNYTHIFDVEDSQGNKFYRVPKDSANLSLNYYPTDSIIVGADIGYVAKRADQDYSSFPSKDVTLKARTVVNLHYSQEINDNLSIRVTAKNILDKKYEDVKGYSTEGRSIYAKVEYKF